MSIDLSKDTFKLHKLSTFQNKDIDKIMAIINHLSIKQVFIDGIRKFLESNEIDYECNFRGEALADEKIELSHLYGMLLEYDLLVEIRREKLNIPIGTMAGCNEPVIFCGRN